MICKANQWTGFYMIRTSIMKELNIVIYTVRYTNKEKFLTFLKIIPVRMIAEQRATDLLLPLHIYGKVLPSKRNRFQKKKSSLAECIMCILDSNFHELQALLISQTYYNISMK